MKLWNRLFLGGLTLALALSLCVGPADAASKKKKKKEAEKKEEHHMRHETHYSGELRPISGGNLGGEPGYFFAPTAQTLNQGQIMGAAHLTFDTVGSALQIPIGATYGITDKIQVNVNTSFFAANGASGIYYLNFGGKYGFGQVLKDSDAKLDIAAGINFSVGPLSGVYGSGYSTFGFDPYGVATLTLPDGLQFNGKLGLYVQTANFNFGGGITGSTSYSYFQLDLGAAYPFDKDLTGIAELATNGVIGNGALGGGTPLVVGIRTGHDVQLQAFGGLDLNYTVGLIVGGGIVLVSQ
jgi:hypothetical protein